MGVEDLGPVDDSAAVLAGVDAGEPGIHVPEDIQEAKRDGFHAQLQEALDRVREFAEANVQNAGSKEFPYCDGRA